MKFSGALLSRQIPSCQGEGQCVSYCSATELHQIGVIELHSRIIKGYHLLSW